MCDIAHRRSVAVLCMLYKIRCNPVHPLNGALHGPYVRVPQDFYSLSLLLWSDLAYPVFDGVGLAGFKSRSNVFLFS